MTIISVIHTNFPAWLCSFKSIERDFKIYFYFRRGHQSQMILFLIFVINALIWCNFEKSYFGPFWLEIWVWLLKFSITALAPNSLKFTITRETKAQKSWAIWKKPHFLHDKIDQKTHFTKLPNSNCFFVFSFFAWL